MALTVETPHAGNGLADVLERILDKGVVIAGDVAISLVGIELLTIRLRLLIATVDKAREIGINWWEDDPHLTRPTSDIERENAQLLERLSKIEAQLAALDAPEPQAS